MLILTRKPSETIVVGDHTVVTVLDVLGTNRVRIGVDAPGFEVCRGEIYEQELQKRKQRRSGPRAVSARMALAQEIAAAVAHVMNWRESQEVLTQTIKVALPADRVELYAEAKAAGKNSAPGQSEHTKIGQLREVLGMTGREHTLSEVVDRARELVEDLHTIQAGSRKAAR
jgi:carbon storage regulator CsrA